MAKGRGTTGRAPQQAANSPTPYPDNWGRMNHQQRQQWMATNRPARDPGAPIPAPQQQPPQQPPQQQPPQQLAQEQPQPPQPLYDAGQQNGPSFTFSYSDLEKMNPLELVADVLRTIADHICPPPGEQEEEEDFGTT